MSTRRHNATILIADDDVSVIKTLSALLETSNYDLQFASDGLQALQLARDLDPDVMLLDVMMPGMSGIDVCRKVREDPELRHIPIIVLTAFNDRSMLVRALDSGADDFMAKPVAGVELRARIRTMLRIRSQFDTLKKVMDGREELVHMAVHDLRTPLNLIAGASELLSRSAAASLSERQKYHIASIMANVQRLEDCIGQILYLAKSEHGSLVLHPQSVDVVKLLERICSEFRDRAQQQNIRVELSAPLSEFALQIGRAHV